MAIKQDYSPLEINQQLICDIDINILSKPLDNLKFYNQLLEEYSSVMKIIEKVNRSV